MYFLKKEMVTTLFAIIGVVHSFPLDEEQVEPFKFPPIPFEDERFLFGNGFGFGTGTGAGTVGGFGLYGPGLSSAVGTAPGLGLGSGIGSGFGLFGPGLSSGAGTGSGLGLGSGIGSPFGLFGPGLSGGTGTGLSKFFIGKREENM